MVSGVRRWITSHPAAVAPKILHHAKKAAVSQQDQKPVHEPVVFDKTSSAAWALQSLDPIVTDADEHDYQKYAVTFLEVKSRI